MLARIRVLLLSLLTACSESPVTLTDADRALGQAVGIPDAPLLAIKTAGQNLLRLQGIDEGGDPFLANGVTIHIDQHDALDAVRSLRRTLGSGYLVFVSERRFGIQGYFDQVAVLKGTDPYDMLRTMGTNAWNYDFGPETIIDRLQKWDEAFGLDLHGVGFDWLEASFREQPDDMDAFAAEVYAFCPDVVDQGTETVERLAKDMRQSKSVFLWWD